MSAETFLDGKVTLRAGDSRDVLKTIADRSIDSIVTDPPYALVSIVKRFGADGATPTKDGDVYSRSSSGFMGKQWDTGETAFAVEFWAEIMRVLKPGGHVVAFSGTRTYHRLAVAIEDAGFEIRDQLAWAYGSGFPKSHDVSKGIDKAAGHWRGRAGAIKEDTVGQVAKGTEYERTDKGEPVTAAAAWAGWGTALKPAWEPIVMARKPLVGTVAANVIEHGTGALNIDGCRVGTDGGTAGTNYAKTGQFGIGGKADIVSIDKGRWPANIIHDGSDEVVAAFPETTSGLLQTHHKMAESENGSMSGKNYARSPNQDSFGDSGSAARFFYSSKADKQDRIGSKHPTVKPVDLMQWLCRLVTPPGGTVLDPFAGTGTTGEAAFREGFNAVLIEREPEYQADIRRRMALCMSGPEERARESIKARNAGQPIDAGPLFGGLDTPPHGAGGSTESSRTNNRTGRIETVNT